MLDPFPIPVSETLSRIVTHFADSAALSVLPLHIHEILIAAAFYHVVCSYVSPPLSRALFPKVYPNFDARTKLNWDVHVVSLVQSVTINVLALWVMICDDQRNAMDWRERVFGYDGALGMIAALACGYFLWDFGITLRYASWFGPGMLAHAASALAVYGFGFRPVIMYYAPVFILFELSSPFLNFHWFFDKLGMTGSKAQLYNGILLMSSFAGSRLIWGSYNCFKVFPDMYKAIQYQKTLEGQSWFAEGVANATAQAAVKGAMNLDGFSHDVDVAKRMAPKPLGEAYAMIYVVSYVLLMLLNIYWFGKMVETIRARFKPPFGTKETTSKGAKPEAKGSVGPVVGADPNGTRGRKTLSENGQTIVELEETEVKQRKPRRKA